ncbi:MAG: sterol desaturase family protein [Planctomycetes bacterium]|nr:sterol desaturase family protein [Planctomycetota bacterium]
MSHEGLIRAGAFLGMLMLMSLWEIIAPRRRPIRGRGRRWIGNLGLVVLSTVIARALLPGIVVATAIIAHERGWGVLSLVSWPLWLEGSIAFVALDLAIYLQHVMTHALPLLWRLHRVHHGDPMIDASTGVRFHPFEILMSLLVKSAVVAALGAPVVAVVVFEIVLNAMAVFNHANVACPPWIDRWLRLLVVTPEMHRVHHSHHRDEQASNFCFNLPWWDRLFTTYRAQPRDGHLGMAIGLPDVAAERGMRWWWMVLSPFVRSEPMRR